LRPFRLIEQPAGIVAQIDYKALELVAGSGCQVSDCFFQAIHGLLAELTDSNETNIISFQP